MLELNNRTGSKLPKTWCEPEYIAQKKHQHTYFITPQSNCSNVLSVICCPFLFGVRNLGATQDEKDENIIVSSKMDCEQDNIARMHIAMQNGTTGFRQLRRVHVGPQPTMTQVIQSDLFIPHRWGSHNL